MTLRERRGGPRGGARTRPAGGRLEDHTCRRFEQAFGADLPAVRVHTSGEVDQANHLLKSHAFTVGGNVYLRRADYRPGTRSGDALGSPRTSSRSSGGTK